jgi:DNA-binding response OmpR family regulator
MPRKNGREVYEEIRRIRPGVKTLFMSGYAADIFEKELIPDQGVNFISKPMSTTELLKKIRATLDHS